MSVLYILFIEFFKIGLFSFGGGYAAIPLIQEVVIVHNKWLSSSTFNDILAISQMTPGPIGINAATFVGLQVSGLTGAIMATLGFVVPSFILASIMGKLYLKYNGIPLIKATLNRMKPVVIAIIFGAGLKILVDAVFVNSEIQYIRICLFILALIIVFRYKLSLIVTMLIIGVLNIILIQL